MGNNSCCENVNLENQPIQQLEGMLQSKTETKNYQNKLQSRHHVQQPIQQQPNRQSANLQDPLNQLIQESQQKRLREENQNQIKLPQLSQEIRQIIHKNGFQQVQFQNLITHRKMYKDDVYLGELDENQLPHGKGKMYKNDGSHFIGLFKHGKAEGDGVLITNTGAYYTGLFVNNKAETEYGEYNSDTLKYEGGFKNNIFHGKGKERGENHEFQGEFSNGLRLKGVLKWQKMNESYEYEGTFNIHNRFDGIGRLKGPLGTYEGNFINGNKDGLGVFQYIDGSKYIGEYSNGVRNGSGKIYDKDQNLIYSGKFTNGIPHETNSQETGQ